MKQSKSGNNVFLFGDTFSNSDSDQAKLLVHCFTSVWPVDETLFNTQCDLFTMSVVKQRTYPISLLEHCYGYWFLFPHHLPEVIDSILKWSMCGYITSLCCIIILVALH